MDLSSKKGMFKEWVEIQLKDNEPIDKIIMHGMLFKIEFEEILKIIAECSGGEELKKDILRKKQGEEAAKNGLQQQRTRKEI